MDIVSYDEELVACIDCGARVDPAADRAFAIGERTVLCFGCCVRRHGVYDAAQERWSVGPDIADVPEDM